ncbi:hypothetical protein PYCC9005_003564 [Savitreella phatthalungensis]
MDEKPKFEYHEEVESLKDEKDIGNDADYSGAAAKTDPKEIRLVRKLDLYIMPTIFIMYMLNYLDRNAIALARLDNLEKDLHLKGVQYNTCVSVLFAGYLLGQIPSNLLITRVRPSIYMASWMAVWAVISTMQGLVKDFKGLLVTRLLLGVTEAPFYPGALYVLSIFYTRKEIATRISILYCGNILATAFAGPIALGIFNGMSGFAGYPGWAWLFFLQGAITFVVACLSILTLPDTPLTTRWLSDDERQLASSRVRRDTVEDQGETSPLRGARQALKDPLLYLFAAIQTFHLGANGFKNLLPSVIATLKLGRTKSLLLVCPPYLLAGAVTIVYSMSSGRHNERTWHITISKLVAIFGFILACATLNVGARYFAICVFCIGTYAVNSLILGWASTVLSQTPDKKASSLAIIMTCANSSFIYTPYLFPKTDEPRYTIGMASSAGFSLATIIGTWILRIWLKRINNAKTASGHRGMLYPY